MLSVTDSKYLSCKHTYLMAGVRATLGQWALKASYNQLDQKGSNAAGASINADDASQFALGADYVLSKRTVIYTGLTAILFRYAIRASADDGG